MAALAAVNLDAKKVGHSSSTPYFRHFTISLTSLVLAPLLANSCRTAESPADESAPIRGLISSDEKTGALEMRVTGG